ncbi:YjbQ family protein [Trinickia terrae]|uniref:YjbQ family protein n=1 Tax=Trinickia terrae TaxID=2571161 RepID=A0A4U1IF48_9BURK|nr:secondary thiamine-phosphate synthase enzyme YjbQ [Trinickia terrae]TKC92346.1 YjbQ family protein [Trinickia terrae]
MKQAITHISVDTRGRGLMEITSQLQGWIDEQGVQTGLLTVFCQHTSASLLIQENADPSVQRDIGAYFERIAPEDPLRYEHDTEGSDDMPAHLRTALTQVHLAIPVERGALTLGTWQGVYVFEHRIRPQRRNVVLHLLGE